MPFFLLSRGSEDRLSLLSHAVFESRSEALAELSRVTNLPGFSGWDDEVLVFEIGTGAPVLLMRPAVAPVADVAVSADVPAETPDTAEIGPDEDAAPLVEADEGEAASQVGEYIEDAAVFEAPAEESTDSVVETVTAEAGAPVVEVDAAWAEAVEESTLQSDGEISLREALRKTAVQMESEGIVAPDSVGPADETSSAGAEATPADENVLIEDQDVAEPAAVEQSVEGAATVEEATASADVPSWPWDVGTGDSELPTFTLDALEEPGTDEMSLVRAPGDDDTMSATRPVIMGAYSEQEQASASEEATEVEVMPEVTEPDSTVVPEPVAESDEPQVVEADTSDEISDFILDLETPDPGSDTPGYAGSRADLGEMTCNDCVYVETCPHKEGSDPRTCGSFQWK